MSKAISIGLHIIDMLGYPISEIPPSQQVLFIDQIKLCVAGTAAASAVGLARLGKKVWSVGVVGNDLLGEILRKQMTSEGVETKFIRTSQNLTTSATILPIRQNGERPALHVRGATAELCFEDFPFSQVESGDVVHIGGTFLMPGLDGVSTELLAREAKSRGAIVTMDFIPFDRQDLRELLDPCLKYLDFIFPNLEDAMFYTGQSSREEVATYFLDGGVQCVVLTLGADGVSIWRKGEAELLMETYDVDVIDTSGCGDAFCSGFISGLLEGLGDFACAERGLACGSLVATGLGSDAGLRDMEQVKKVIANGAKLMGSWRRVEI
jgi:sugar/nucleoside kinase (ribokinase family)